MGWLPRIFTEHWIGCSEVDGRDIEGVTLVLAWRAWQVEISIGRASAR